ncbi:MAG: host attachment protein [Nevskiales bacterium]|nr:host attachment protein [Nevskiales bacterium]
MTYAAETGRKGPIVVLVADRSEARFYACEDADAALAPIESVAHPEGRLRNHDLVSDSAGLTIGSGYREGAPTGGTPATEHEAQRFAKALAHRLDELRNDNALGSLYLIAEPHFLGLLRAELSTPCRDRVAGEVHHRLIDSDVGQIRAALPQQL